MAEPPEPTSLERLRGCLASPFTDVVLFGLDEVAGHQDPTLARLVLPCLDASQPPVRRRAARVLGQLGSPRAADALVLRLEDDDPGVALEAAWALEQLRPTDEVVSARRQRAAPAGPTGSEDDSAALAAPPEFREAPPTSGPAAPSPPTSASRRAPAPAPAPAPASASAPPRAEGQVAPAESPRGEVGPGTDLGMLLSSLEENAERRTESSGTPRTELLLVCAFLGFVFGRFLPGMQEEISPLPPPTGSLTRARAREVLFPGDGVLARLGRGASLVLEDDSRGVALLDAAVTEFHFAPRERREADEGERFRLELESEGNPLGPPGAWRPRLDGGEGAEGGALPAAEDLPAPPEPPAWAQPPAATVEAPPAVAEVPASPREDPMPSMVSRAEETLYKAAARRYLEAGDRQHAIELLETLTGRNFPGDELERYLAQP